jgi:hypothetical protein
MGTLDEFSRYFATLPEDVKNEDVLKWWHEHKHVYPRLYRMAVDYHTVPCKYLCFHLQMCILLYMYINRYLCRR